MFGAQQSGCSPTQSFVHTAAEAAECNSNVNLRFSCQQVLSESKCRLSCIGHVPFLCHLVLLVIRVFALLSFGLSCFFSFSPVLLVHHPKMSQINHFWIVFLLFPLWLLLFLCSPTFVARPENVGVGPLSNTCFYGTRSCLWWTHNVNWMQYVIIIYSMYTCAHEMILTYTETHTKQHHDSCKCNETPWPPYYQQCFKTCPQL